MCWSWPSVSAYDIVVIFRLNEEAGGSSSLYRSLSGSTFQHFLPAQDLCTRRYPPSISFTLKMTTAMYVKTLEQLQHTTQKNLIQTAAGSTHRTAIRSDRNCNVLSAASCMDGCCKGLPALQDGTCAFQQYQYSPEGTPRSQACAYSEWLQDGAGISCWH